MDTNTKTTKIVTKTIGQLDRYDFEILGSSINTPEYLKTIAIKVRSFDDKEFEKFMSEIPAEIKRTSVEYIEPDTIAVKNMTVLTLKEICHYYARTPEFLKTIEKSLEKLSIDVAINKWEAIKKSFPDNILNQEFANPGESSIIKKKPLLPGTKPTVRNNNGRDDPMAALVKAAAEALNPGNEYSPFNDEDENNNEDDENGDNENDNENDDNNANDDKSSSDCKW
jgi:ribosomal protein S10